MEEDRKDEEIKEEVEEIKEENIIEKETTEEDKNEEPEENKEEKEEELENTQVIRKQEPPKKKKTGIKVIVIVLLLILIAILCYAAFINFKPTKKTINNESKEYKSELRLSGNGLEDFDLYFMKLENNKTNSVYSPLSIKYALAMLSEGAKGDTKEQIDAIIGDYKAKAYPNNEHMSFANAMFIRDTYKDKVNESYTTGLKDKFGAEVVVDSFASSDNINNWVSNRTFKLISNLFTDESISQDNFILLNALAIDMYWNNQIDCARGSLDRVHCVDEQIGYSVIYDHEKISDEDIEYKNENHIYMTESEFPGIDFNGISNVKTGKVLADFNRYDAVKEIGEDKIRNEVGEAYKKWLQTKDGKELVSYGSAEPDVNKYLDNYIKDLNNNYNKEAKSTDFYLYDDKDVKAFAKDLQEYDDMNLQYVGIMPKNIELNEYIDNVKSSDITSIINNLKDMKKENFKDGVATIITGNIPFFKFEHQLDLMKDLKELGVKDVFTDGKADLSGIIKDDNKNGVVASHKANIEFSNEGIRAAAYTYVEAGSTSGEGFNYLYKIPVEKIDITFNKPYMYIIRDKDSGEVWFTGTVYEPIRKDY